MTSKNKAYVLDDIKIKDNDDTDRLTLLLEKSRMTTEERLLFNKKKAQDKQKEIYNENKDDILQKRKQYYENNKERIKARQREYYQSIKSNKIPNKKKIPNEERIKIYNEKQNENYRKMKEALYLLTHDNLDGFVLKKYNTKK